MKINISPTGDMSIETNGSNAADVVRLIRELRKPVPKGGEEGPASLNDLQGATYDWLVENDCEMGVHVAAMGKHFGITSGAAGQRCSDLMKMGFVRRIVSGRYRAVTE